jgi:hypothetical protein
MDGGAPRTVVVSFFFFRREVQSGETRFRGMGAKWEWRIAASIESAEAAIRSMGWEEAQRWCNFVLMRPAGLPHGLSVEQVEVRPEAPPGRYPGMDMTGRFVHNYSNRATHLCTISGDGRRLHIKQLLYDLGPPAFDHPSFWLERPQAFLVGDHVGWLGTDFRGLKATSVHLDRTMVETSVQEGEFSDEELKSICRGLRPAVPSARERILATPFADLCYPGRYEDLCVTVPMGYWKHRRRPSTLTTTAKPAGEVPQSWSSLAVGPPPQYNFRLDTALAIGDPAQPQEIEWLYENDELPGHYIRVLTWPVGAPNAPTFPLEVDRQPCSTETASLKGREVHYAFLDQRFGQFEAIWQQDETIVMLMVKPAPWTNKDWFLRLLHATL